MLCGKPTLYTTISILIGGRTASTAATAILLTPPAVLVHTPDPERRVFTLGVGGPVGSGKTALVERFCREFWPARNLAVVTNDIYTREDAEFLRGGRRCRWSASSASKPAAVRTAPSAKTPASTWPRSPPLKNGFRSLETVVIESGGDNLAATFSPELADRTIYVIDVAEGDKIPRKGGPGIPAATCSSSTRSTLPRTSAPTST